MLIFSKIAELEAFLNTQRAAGKTVGFVPTMGALHPGHVSLIARSKTQCDLTVCSIFVNPTQFNDQNDLARYPRVPERDIALLEKAACEALFMPSVEEVYPRPEKETFDFGYLNTILEGKYRPGHFNGVAQVVKRLFNIVKPDKAFFGSKDYQQVMIVKALVKQMHSPVDIVACPILREADGLAMSSRNALLNPGERAAAASISTIMQEACAMIRQEGIAAAKSFVKSSIEALPLMKLDYYEVCEADSLLIADTVEKTKQYITLIAAFAGRIRLIDNLPLDQ